MNWNLPSCITRQCITDKLGNYRLKTVNKTLEIQRYDHNINLFHTNLDTIYVNFFKALVFGAPKIHIWIHQRHQLHGSLFFPF